MLLAAISVLLSAVFKVCLKVVMHSPNLSRAGGNLPTK